MGYKFKNSKISFPITDENDTVIKDYTIDIGKEAFLREMQEKGKGVAEKLKNFNDENVLECLDSMRDFVDIILGAGEFDFLYKSFDNNVFAAIELTNALTNMIKNEMNKRMSVHG